MIDFTLIKVYKHTVIVQVVDQKFPRLIKLVRYNLNLSYLMGRTDGTVSSISRGSIHL